MRASTMISWPSMPPRAPTMGLASPSPSISMISWFAINSAGTPFLMNFSSISSLSAARSSARRLASRASLRLRFSSSLMASWRSSSALTCFFLSISALTVSMWTYSSETRCSAAKLSWIWSWTSRSYTNSKTLSCSQGTTSLSSTLMRKLFVKKPTSLRCRKVFSRRPARYPFDTARATTFRCASCLFFFFSRMFAFSFAKSSSRFCSFCSMRSMSLFSACWMRW
mmetsp:Transcript_12836/g.21722  ORF Transcript_12836/g.21722 Transcript_12836/m.21722 type:complete len:225 (+) Transcript_12836:223-897(+)